MFVKHDDSKRLQDLIKALATLAPHLQKEVIDFVGYLKSKQVRSAQMQDKSWSELSIRSALHDLEDEEFPSYSDSDLKQIWNS